jgi:hypothetical protein
MPAEGSGADPPTDRIAGGSALAWAPAGTSRCDGGEVNALSMANTLTPPMRPPRSAAPATMGRIRTARMNKLKSGNMAIPLLNLPHPKQATPQIGPAFLLSSSLMHCSEGAPGSSGVRVIRA